ncbi:MAG: hypothetical protein O3C15_05270 [Proteobacteria bacterium]|nr:hypothetical protein [Pseudomonadota bacterium]
MSDAESSLIDAIAISLRESAVALGAEETNIVARRKRMSTTPSLVDSRTTSGAGRPHYRHGDFQDENLNINVN